MSLNALNFFICINIIKSYGKRTVFFFRRVNDYFTVCGSDFFGVNGNFTAYFSDNAACTEITVKTCGSSDKTYLIIKGNLI